MGDSVGTGDRNGEHPMHPPTFPLHPTNQVWSSPVEILGKTLGDSIWPPCETLGWGSRTLRNESRRRSVSDGGASEIPG